MDEELLSLSRRLGFLLCNTGFKLKTAESFTGGAVSSAIIMTEGASEFFDEGFICYSPESKLQRLGINKENLDTYDAVSLPVLKDMLQGLLLIGADFAAATTGNAGPSAKSGEVGECYVGAASRNRMIIKRFLFEAETISPETRQNIILSGAKETLKCLIEIITHN